MKILVIGASGATGKLVVSKLIENNHSVKVIIRKTAIFPKELIGNNKIEIIKGNITDFTITQLTEIISNCDAVISCLGHNITFKGIFGKPRKLVAYSIQKIEESIKLLDKNYKLILMSTTAYTNKSDGEKNTFGEKIIFDLLKVLLPPHADNVTVGNFLIKNINKTTKIEWVAVRPDSLIDEASASEYIVVENKIRSPIFNPGKTSRINVANFMCELLTNDLLWENWKYKTPVIYNKC